MQGTTARAPISILLPIDLTNARVQPEAFDIDASEINVTYFPADTVVHFAVSPEGPFYTVTGPGRIDLCGGTIPKLYVKNDAQPGRILEVQFSPDGVRFDFPKGEAAPDAAARRTVHELTGNSVNSLVDHVTGLAAGTGGTVWNGAGFLYPAQHATKKFVGVRLDTQAGQSEYIAFAYDVPIQTLFSPDVVGRNLAPYIGKQWIFAGDFYAERTYTPSASEIAHFIGFGFANGNHMHPGFGLWLLKAGGNWSLALNDSLNGGDRPPIIDVATTLPALDTQYAFELIVGVDDEAEPYLEAWLNGELAAEWRGVWPSAMNAAAGLGAFIPRMRVYRQNILPDDARMYTLMNQSLRFQVVD